jgi:CheY-like chemotaxis protein
LNLGLNARDAMPNGGTLMLRASRHCVDPDSAFPHAVSPGDYLCVSVSDDGEGMDDATQARIFEPFFTTKAPGKGTGMGLASVYGTVRSHGGSISVVSAPGAGSTFEILLPETKSTRVPTTRLRHTEPATRPLKILIVDDEPVIRRVLSRLLETLGHTPSMCVDGVDAVDHYRQFGSTIDLVILDMVMPRQGGRDTFFALRQINPAVRVLISSGFTVEGGAQTLLTHGAAGFLQKPFALERLAEAIEHARR